VYGPEFPEFQPKTCYPKSCLDRGADANSSRRRGSGHLRSGRWKGHFRRNRSWLWCARSDWGVRL